MIFNDHFKSLSCKYSMQTRRNILLKIRSDRHKVLNYLVFYADHYVYFTLFLYLVRDMLEIMFYPETFQNVSRPFENHSIEHRMPYCSDSIIYKNLVFYELKCKKGQFLSFSGFCFIYNFRRNTSWTLYSIWFHIFIMHKIETTTSLVDLSNV